MNGYFWHPLHGVGYQFWSGIAGSFLTSIPGWVAVVVLYARHHNCTEKRCWRLGHPDPEHGHPVCRVHQHKLGG